MRLFTKEQLNSIYEYEVIVRTTENYELIGNYIYLHKIITIKRKYVTGKITYYNKDIII